MISNHVIQITSEGIKNICKADVCVMDVEGRIAATTFDGAEKLIPTVLSFVDSPADCQEAFGAQFIKIFDENELEYVVIVKGESDNLYTIAKLAAFQIQNLIVAYKEKYDKDVFIKNLLLDNMLVIDMYNRARKLHIEPKVRRVVFIIETGNRKDDYEYTENNELWIIRSLFTANRSKDFVTAVDERNIILVKEIQPTEDKEILDSVANMLLDMLNTEAMTNVHVAYGTVVEDIKDLSRSYREARVALEIRKIFYEDKGFVSYDNLGIGRLIYQLPEQLCTMFVEEALKGYSIDDFDDETVTTLTKFFNNNLNVSETARQLFIHRNTLVYRIDKIQKMTGLDLRIFDNVVVFKVALMVSKYLKYLENNSDI